MRPLSLLAIISICGCSLAGCSSAANSVTAVNENINASTSPTPAGTPVAAGAESTAEAARALVIDLYLQHEARKGPFFQDKDRALVDKYFTKTLADLIWKDAKTSGDEVGAIDGDPLYNAQDTDIKNFKVGDAVVNGQSATVPVTFTNFGQKQTVTYAMKLVGDAWKIDDIKYGGNDSLMKWLKAASAETPPQASTGEFEGTYQVGETTCTVKPVKMAFEIRWAKGKGSEMYFYKDANVFGSEADKNGGRNEFRFDDENYDSGTFVRADGKTYTVTRAN